MNSVFEEAMAKHGETGTKTKRSESKLPDLEGSKASRGQIKGKLRLGILKNGKIFTYENWRVPLKIVRRFVIVVDSRAHQPQVLQDSFFRFIS